MSEVATIHPQAVSQADATVHVLDRLIRDPSVDLARVEHAIALRERMLDRIAREDFDRALSDCQAEIRRVAADSSNPQTKSKYASYAALDRAVRPIYSKNGFSLTFDTGPDAPENFVRVLCRVAGHGHREVYHIDMPADGKGAKGGDVMTRTHATGSAATYGRRYLLMMIFNIAIGDDPTDDDGNAAGTDQWGITEEQVVTLADLIKETKSDLNKFCTYFRIDCLPALPAKDFNRAIAALEKKRKS